MSAVEMNVEQAFDEKSVRKEKIILSGNLKDMNFSSLFQLLQLSEKRGILLLENTYKKAEMIINKKFILQASSPDDILFGEYLVTNGHLTEEELTEAIQIQKITQQRLGEIIAGQQKDRLRSIDMKSVLNRYLREVIYRIMKWTVGEFYFTETDEAFIRKVQDPNVQMNISFLILENGQRAEEWKTLTANIASLESTLKLNKEAVKNNASFQLTADQWLVLSYVNGRRTILRILEKIGTNEPHYLSIINEMIKNGWLIEKQIESMKIIVPRRVPANQSSKERYFPSKLSANILYKEIDGKKSLYQLLLLQKTKIHELWEDLNLLIKNQLVEIAEGKREFQNLAEDM